MTFASGHHQVIYNGGAQTLRTVPINRQGRPTPVSVCTYRIVDLRLSEEDPLRLISSGNATLDATTTTTTAACGLGTSNARKIPLTSVVGFSQGRQYLITHTDGTRELVLCEAVGTNYLIPRNEISKRFESGVTVRGIEVSCSFPSIEAADESKFQDQGGPYAVDWAWDLDPSPRREIAFIIRAPDSLLITEEELLAIDPSLAPTTGQRTSLPTCIRQAAMEVRALCQMSQVDPDNFHGGTTLRLAVAYRAAWHVMKQKAGPENAERTTLYKEESQRYLDAVLIGRAPEKSVKTNPVTDSAPAGTTKGYNHWQVIS